MNKTIEKILDLIGKTGKPDYVMTKEIGLNSNAINDWRSGKAKPSSDSIVKIANYFNVSTDYLLCRAEEQKSPPTPAEQVGIEGLYFHLAKEAQDMELPEEDIQAILDFAKFLKSKNKE